MSRRPAPQGFSVEVVTGGRPVEAYLRAVGTLLSERRGEVWLITAPHDDGCPAVETAMPFCTYEIVDLRRERAA